MHPIISQGISPASKMEWPARNELLDSTETGLLHFVSAFFRRSLQQLFDTHSGPDLRLDVNHWVFGLPIVLDESDVAPLSFQHCCQVLGLDPLEVRELIQGYLVRTKIIDHIDNRTMAVRDKSKSVEVKVDARSAAIQLVIFADDDPDFEPPPLPERSARTRSTNKRGVEPDEFGVQMSMFDLVDGLCA